MILLEEFDNNKKAVINSSDIYKRLDNMPKVAIACFSHMLFDKIVAGGKCTVITILHNTGEKKVIYEIEYEGHHFALFRIGVGAPVAVADIEELHALGIEKFIVFGNCGVLDDSIEDCSVIIPNMALRDEGTSFHYMEPSDTVKLNEKYVNEFKEILDRLGYDYIEGATWTTDAFYRETKEKVARRKEAGAITVEMEASALQAVCNFRGCELFIFFYAGDNLAGEKWDKRSLSGDIKLDEKSQIAYLALELASKISED
jgi:uridine phosphorylase